MKEHNERANIPVSNDWGMARLRLFFLVPMAVAISIIIIVLSSILIQQTNQNVENGVIRIRTSVQDFYEESIRYDAGALKAILNVMHQDEKISIALAQKDRLALLQRTKASFEEIRHNFGITHLYFTSTERINILRAHAPLKYGDIISRTTTLQAEKSGTVAYGVELGALGTFTLRVVEPWYDKKTNKLIGYVELGMEIDHVIDKLQDFFGVTTFTLIDKKFLDKEEWEAGMRTLGRTPKWEEFKDSVTGLHSINTVSATIVNYLKNKDLTTRKGIISMKYGDLSYYVTLLPLHDADGRSVAHMVLVNNVSEEKNIAYNTVLLVGSTAIISGLILFIFFYWQVGRVGKRIEDNEENLRNMATHDGLTGLYNHRYFYTLLEREVMRSKRYEHNISLLLIDIDHFKNVNDTYGHRAGDTILHDLSERLIKRVRGSDTVCRYGGEEITVILPETDTDSAKSIAEGLRIMIEQKDFEIKDGRYVPITVSIGLSSYPDHAQEIADIVSNADTALYEAKESGRNRVCIYKS